MNKSESKYFNTATKMNNSLISLLKKKPFEYITVSELCKEAGVNRSTFYLHYETIGDLLDETFEYIIDGFLSYFSLKKRNIAFNYDSCKADELNFIREDYLTPYLTYIKENKEVFTTALSNERHFGLFRIYEQMFESIFNPILERFNYPYEDRKYVMMYYLNGINAIINEWLKDNCKKSIQDIQRIIKECIFGLNNCLVEMPIP